MRYVLIAAALLFSAPAMASQSYERYCSTVDKTDRPGCVRQMKICVESLHLSPRGCWADLTEDGEAPGNFAEGTPGGFRKDGTPILPNMEWPVKAYGE